MFHVFEKMFHVFEKIDIKFGMIVRRKQSKVYSVLAYSIKDTDKGENRDHYLIEINTDGLLRVIGNNKKEVAEFLTKNNYLLINNKEEVYSQ